MIDTILRFKYDYDVDDLYNPAYGAYMDNDTKAEKMFEALKENAYHTEWYGKKPHDYNGNDNCETGFFIAGYYVSFMMMEEHGFLVRIHVGCFDIDIYTDREDLYIIDLNSSLRDFENRFGTIL